MRILVAPDKFRDFATARVAAGAMAAGARVVLPDSFVDVVALADGGEGTGDVLADALRGRSTTTRVAGPLGDPVDASFWRLRDGRRVVEVAAAVGLSLVPEDRRDAVRASSRGAGEVIRAALADMEAGGELLVAIGGTAATDGGTGLARAMGWRFLDRWGREIGEGAAELQRLHQIDGFAAMPVDRYRITGACDVDNPLVGPDGAARIFAPQKGASPGEVSLLEEGLARLAACIGSQLGVSVNSAAGAGAGGGIGAALMAFMGATLSSGFEVVAHAVRLRERLGHADLVVTGEGRIDVQTARGKVVSRVARLARDLGIPCLAVAGEVRLNADRLRAEGIVEARDLEGARDPGGAPEAISVATRRLLLAYGRN